MRPLLEAHVVCRAVESLARDAGEALAHPQRCEVGCARDGAGEAARIVAGGDGPGVPLRIVLQRHRDPVRRQSQRVAHHLREDRAVALALGQRVGHHRDGAERVDRDRGVADGAVLGPRLAPFLGRQHRGDVTHVGDAGLHRGGEADAVEPALRPCRIAFGAQGIERSLRRAVIERGGEVAGIEQGAGGGAVRHGVGRHQIAPDDVKRVEAEHFGHALHQALQRIVELRPAEAPVEPRRRLVGDDDAVRHREMGDAVGAGEVAVAAVERRGLRCLQVGAAVLQLIEAERRDAAVGLHRRLDLRHPVGRGVGRQQVLQPVLDPLDRARGLPRRERHGDDEREDRLLDPEAAARIRHGAQPEPRPPAP